MNFSNDLLMAEKIEKAKLKAEAEYRAKQEKASQSDIVIDDVLTAEQLDKILSDNEFFNGKVLDLSAAQRYEKVKQAVLWMDAHSIEVNSVQIENVSSARPNAIITMSLRRLSSFKGQELKVFSLLCAMCDTMFMSSVKDDVIRITFGIENVWQE